VRTRRTAVIVALAVVLVATATAGQAAAATRLRLDGIGPLRLGMTRSAAVATGWLAHPRGGCPLGGTPLPVVFRFDGPRAPRGLRGDAEFERGRLRDLSFTRGVRTAVGVVGGRTTTADMVARYRIAGFMATSRFDTIFGGTFVTVRRRPHHPQVIGGFGAHRVVTTLAIPAVPVCD
jgi:hypothetical protein